MVRNESLKVILEGMEGCVIAEIKGMNRVYKRSLDKRRKTPRELSHLLSEPYSCLCSSGSFYHQNLEPDRLETAPNLPFNYFERG